MTYEGVFHNPTLLQLLDNPCKTIAPAQKLQNAHKNVERLWNCWSNCQTSKSEVMAIMVYPLLCLVFVFLAQTKATGIWFIRDIEKTKCLLFLFNREVDKNKWFLFWFSRDVEKLNAFCFGLVSWIP